jgi:hypothetical protein
MTRRRPWAVMGRSHEYEWNGRVGRRFASEEAARAFAARMIDYGWYEVVVLYAPVVP